MCACVSACVCGGGVCVCVCVQVYISWWGLKPEYTQTHGDSFKVLMGTKAYKSYRMSFFEKVKMQKVSCKG